MSEVNPLIKYFDVISNPFDLKIEIKDNNCKIFRASSGEKLSDVILISNEGSDYPAQVGKWLKSMIREVKKIKSNSSNIKLFDSQAKKLEDIEIMTVSQADIIEAGLREHDGEFKTCE